MLRRDFVTGLFSSAALSGKLLGQSSSSNQTPKRKRGGGKKLVVIFLRGGNDGLNTLIPIESTQYQRYQTLRPNIGLPLANISSLNGNPFFGIHPALDPLRSVHNAGHLSFIHAVGYPNPDRSHFESEAFYETATPGNTLIDGWLNRLLQFGPSAGGLIRGVCIGYR